MLVGKYAREIAQRAWPDYAVFIGLVAFLVILREAVDGNKRPFTPGTFVQDSAFPYKSTDTVPSWALQTIMWLLPVGSIITAWAVGRLTLLQAHQHVLNFMIMYTLTGVLTNCVKLQIGRPRPSFMARCFPSTNESETRFEPIPFSSASQALCTNEDEGAIADSYKSFPSGHASYSASSGMYFTLLLMQVLRVFGGTAPAAFAVIALVPVSVGVWVGLTRISDFEHHFTDVLAGAVLGTVIATVFFFQAQAVEHDEQTNTLESDTEYPPGNPHLLHTSEGLRPEDAALRIAENDAE